MCDTEILPMIDDNSGSPWSISSIPAVMRIPQCPIVALNDSDYQDVYGVKCSCGAMHFTGNMLMYCWTLIGVCHEEKFVCPNTEKELTHTPIHPLTPLWYSLSGQSLFKCRHSRHLYHTHRVHSLLLMAFHHHSKSWKSVVSVKAVCAEYQTRHLFLKSSIGYAPFVKLLPHIFIEFSINTAGGKLQLIFCRKVRLTFDNYPAPQAWW